MAAGSKKVVYAALVGNGLITITKFIAASMTGSSAMFSEGIHSAVDCGNQCMILLGLRKAARPATPEHPFGHGKEIYFWSFVVAVSIFAVGAGVSIFEGIERLQHPHAIENPRINYIVLILAMIFEGFAWAVAYKEFAKVKGDLGLFEAVRRGKDPTMFVVLFEDTAAMLGLIVAFVGIWLGQVTGNPMWDGIAAITIGVILALTAVILARETKSLLIGESAGQVVVGQIREYVDDVSEVVAINEIFTMHMGPEYILVNISVDFHDSARVVDVERAVARLDRTIKANIPQVKRVFVEAESRFADDSDRISAEAPDAKP